MHALFESVCTSGVNGSHCGGGFFVVSDGGRRGSCISACLLAGVGPAGLLLLLLLLFLLRLLVLAPVEGFFKGSGNLNWTEQEWEEEGGKERENGRKGKYKVSKVSRVGR